MRVVSKLARIDFQIGNLVRKGDELVLESHPDQEMQMKAYVDADDIVKLLRLGMRREVIGFLIAIPRLRTRRRRSRGSESAGKGSVGDGGRRHD